ncbi:MAG: DUF2855 family protein [Sphingomonas sp.]
MSIERVLIKRNDIAQCRVAHAPMQGLTQGEVLVRVGDFALTANNISYAVAGERIGYWQFFPVDAEWGVVPVWGFGDVIESQCDDLPVGARFWGFLPMASHVVMRPGRVSARGFVDTSDHRAALPPVYNQYALTANDPAELAAMADARSLLFPLLTTSYLIADYLADMVMFGAEQVIIGSASSKTGFGTAHFVGALLDRPATITGLTSAGNLAFTTGLGLYDKVVLYGDVDSLDASVPTVYVDMSGDSAVLAAVHHHFGDNIKASIGVGATHWEAPRLREALPGAAPAFFFAPSQIQKRDAEWGAGEMMRRATIANMAFVVALGDQLTITHRYGAQAVAEAYRGLVAGTTPPTAGLILGFGEESAG